jgi:hypothetical protein
MPSTKVTCGECGVSETFPDGDWATVQEPAVAAWQEQHELDEHDGDEPTWSLDPDPFRNRAP